MISSSIKHRRPVILSMAMFLLCIHPLLAETHIFPSK